MIEIKFGRDCYSKHYDIVQWCLDNIGFSAWSRSDISEDTPFHHTEGFGYLFLTFYREEDAIMLKLHWGGEIIDTDKKVSYNADNIVED